MGIRKNRWGFVLLSGLVLLVAVTSAAAGFSFTDGEFNSVIYVNPANAAFEVNLVSFLSLRFQFDNVGVQLVSLFRETGWDYQILNVFGAIGAANFAADVRFKPMTSELDSAELLGILFAFGADLRATLIIEPGSSGAITEIMGQSIDASVLFGLKMFFNADAYGHLLNNDCHMDFSGAEVFVRDFTLPCCPDLSISASMTFTATGFEALTFEIGRLALEAFPWIALNGELRFEPDEKTLELRVFPNLPSPWDDCFFMNVSFEHGASLTEIAGIRIESLSVKCEIEGIGFEAVSYPNTGRRARMRTRPIASNLSERYWEWYRIWAEQDGCCGPFGFEVAFYFLEGGVRLFDLSAIQALLSAQLAPGVELGSAMEFDLEVGSWVYADLYFKLNF